jgi:hypothetical protein
MVQLDAVHRYYCDHCKKAVFGGDTGELALAVNAHNDKMHPMEFSGWVSRTIIKSTRYAGPSEPPSYLVPYLQPETAAPGSVKTAGLTAEDRDWLAMNRVRWEE